MSEARLKCLSQDDDDDNRGGGSRKKVRLLCCAPVSASRRKSLLPLARLDACGDRRGPQGRRLKTFCGEHDVNKRKGSGEERPEQIFNSQL